jgi:hypothetical protein
LLPTPNSSLNAAQSAAWKSSVAGFFAAEGGALMVAFFFAYFLEGAAMMKAGQCRL